MMFAPAGDQQHQGAAVWIAAFDDGAKSAFGFGLPNQSGRFELCRKALRQAGIRQGR